VGLGFTLTLNPGVGEDNCKGIALEGTGRGGGEHRCVATVSQASNSFRGRTIVQMGGWGLCYMNVRSGPDIDHGCWVIQQGLSQELIGVLCEESGWRSLRRSALLRKRSPQVSGSQEVHTQFPPW